MKFLIYTLAMCTTPDADLIKQSRLQQNEAMAKGKTELAASFWTDDVTLRRGLGTAVHGKEAYRALLDSPILFVRIPDAIEVSPHWPLAYESGNWTALKEDQTIMTGKYAAQWVKRADKWLIRSELFVALQCEEDPGLYPNLP